MSIERVIENVLRRASAEVDQNVIEALATIVRAANAENPKAYAWVVARNHVVDEMRAAEAAERRAVREAAERRKALEVKSRMMMQKAAREAFWTIVDEASKDVAPQCRTFEEQMLCVWYTDFECLSQEELDEIFQVSRDCRHQWTRRGRVLLSKYNDENIAQWLHYCARTRAAIIVQKGGV